MDKPQIIGLGLSGLVGSRITELLSDQFEFINLGRKNGVDITDPISLTKIKDFEKADYILHMAAKTDVDACEKDKNLEQSGEAWKINTEGTKNVAEICRETGKKIIYISTDFVFDGEKPEGEFYSEEDQPNPVNWYARTKYEGEKAVEGSGTDYIIVRPGYPYRASFDEKIDFMRTIKLKLERGEEIKAVTDHIFCPTFIDDFGKVLEVLIKNDVSGIYHAVGNQALSPYEATIAIAKVFGLPKNLITKTTREEFFKDAAPRPYNLALANAKIEQIGVKMKGFEEGLLAVKSQLQ